MNKLCIESETAVTGLYGDSFARYEVGYRLCYSASTINTLPLIALPVKKG